MQQPFGPSFGNFLKDNAKFYAGGLGGLGLIFPFLDIKNIVESDNKFKAILKTLKDFILVRIAFVGTFTAMGAAIRALVKDTGSLEAAIKRLGTMQALTREFAPLVGGKSAAKNEVASLLAFSGNTPFKFEDIAGAQKTLLTTTHGQFQGTGALQKVGDAAAASGNGIQESAAAVGQFYEALHNGEPIHQAVEQLRQMGIISELTATNLERLADSGSSSVDMANSMARALEESKGGMKDYAQDLEAVGLAHDKAVEKLKAGFGAGFVKPEIENVKNYTKAINNISPALEEAGKFFSQFFTAFSSTGSKITEFISRSKILQEGIKILAPLLTAAAIALTAFGVAAIPVVGPFAALGIILVGIGASLYALKRSFGEAARELKELNKAHRQAQASIDAHAASIQTLTDLQEAYGRQVAHIIDLQNELNEAEKKGDTKKIKEIVRALEEAHAKMANLPAAQSLASKERGDVIRERLEEGKMRESQRFEEAVAARPGEAPRLRKERASVLEERAEAGRQGLQTRQRVAEAQGNLLPQQAALQAEIGGYEKIREKDGKLGAEQKARLAAAKDQLADITGRMLKIQDIEGRGASVGLEAQAQRIQHAQQANVLEAQAADTVDKQEQKRLRVEAAREKIMAGGAVAGPDAGRRIQDLQAQAAELVDRETHIKELAGEARTLRFEDIQQTREQVVGREEMGAETGAARSRIAGDTRGRERFQDIGAFLQSFEQFRQTYGAEEARNMALQKRSNELMEEVPTAIRPVADSLTRVGGGGGVAGPSGADPAQRVRERIAMLQKDSLDVLKHIDDAVSKEGTPEAGGGAAKPELELPAGAPGTPEETQAPEGAGREWVTGTGVVGPSMPQSAEGQQAAAGEPQPTALPEPGKEEARTDQWPPTFSAPAAPTAKPGEPQPTALPGSSEQFPDQRIHQTLHAEEVREKEAEPEQTPAPTPSATHWREDAKKRREEAGLPPMAPSAQVTPKQTFQRLESVSRKAMWQYYSPEQVASKQTIARAEEGQTQAQPKGKSEKDTVSEAISQGRIGTKEHPLPKIPIDPLKITTKVSPIKVSPVMPPTKTDYALLSVLKDISKTGKESNTHLGAIADDSNKGAF